jgi:hypothetical protein
MLAALLGAIRHLRRRQSDEERRKEIIGVDEEKQFSTVEGLDQGYVVVEADQRFLLLYSFLKKMAKKKVIVFLSSSTLEAPRSLLSCRPRPAPQGSVPHFLGHRERLRCDRRGQRENRARK